MSTSETHDQPSRSDLEKVRKQLAKIPGVVSVGIGFKEVAGKSTDTVSFRVYVLEKKKPDELQPEHIIPTQIMGMVTDVTVVPVRKRLADTKKYRPIKGGTKIRNGACRSACYGVAGTLGCLAVLDADGSVVLLSNQHVLGVFGEGIGDEIGQPGGCCCCCFKDVIANIVDRQFGGKVDCAIARIKKDVALPTDNMIRGLGGKDPSGKDIDAAIQGLAPLQQENGQDTTLKVGDAVKKVGIITGLTQGEVQQILFPVKDAESGLTLQDQIDIKPAAGFAAFAEEGDSGAVILNAANEIAGLLWGGDDTGLGTANDIRNVISAMKITIPKTLPAPTPGPTPSPSPSPAPSPSPSPLSALVGGTSLGTHVEDAAEDEDVFLERDLFRKFENQFMETPKGAAFVTAFKENGDEGLNLVNHNRHVTLTWRRKQGPAFLAAFAKGVEDPAYKVPKIVNGVALETLLTNMAVVLEEHGSERMRRALADHAVDIFVYAKKCDSLEDLLERLKREV